MVPHEVRSQDHMMSKAMLISALVRLYCIIRLAICKHLTVLTTAQIRDSTNPRANTTKVVLLRTLQSRSRVT